MRTTPIQMTAMAVALAAVFPALAQNTASSTTLTPVIVTANGIPTRDSDATYASEVHDREAIKASGAATLYDFLAKNTMLNVLPSYGNKNQPALDMRGYGLESGYQNLVVIVDGYRLNDIDQNSPFLGGIPVDSIESIEISKGSGSVSTGDGAMAGVLHIRTRARNGVSISGVTGSRGAQELSFNAGLTRELFDLSFMASNSKQAHMSSPDTKGQRDGSGIRAERLNLTVKPISGLKLFLGASGIHGDNTRYPNRLSPAQFNADPGQSGGIYTHQRYQSDQWRAGFEYALTQNLSARYMRNVEDKTSSASFSGGAPFGYDSNYVSDDGSLLYRSDNLDLTAGVQRFNGERRGTSDMTSKDNTALYVQGVYRVGAWTVSGGTRREKVEYGYNPNTGNALQGDHKLSAWDVGVNYRFNERWSAFTNLNQAFQAPDVDRFFDAWTGTFNGFIKPAEARTLNVGVNHDTTNNRLRMAVFYSKLKNEIYYDPVGFSNTNLDKSHKSGLELSDRWQATDKLGLYASYAYTRAIIDSNVMGGVALTGKSVPGVPRHALTLGVSYQPWTGGMVNLNHAWRDTAYAVSNFKNDGAFKQDIYSSTSLSFRQRWKNVEGFVGIDNLFDRKNGLWVYSNSSNNNGVYPVDFRRTARVGVKVDLF